MENELVAKQTEYVPSDLLYNFISKSLPDIEIFKMKMPIDVDENGIEMYITQFKIIGIESDGEQAIANGCLEFLMKEINRTGHKKLGIYRLSKNIYKETTKSPDIILEYAFPQTMEISDVDDTYTPKFMKDIKPFDYKSGDIMKNINEKRDI